LAWQTGAGVAAARTYDETARKHVLLASVLDGQILSTRLKQHIAEYSHPPRGEV